LYKLLSYPLHDVYTVWMLIKAGCDMTLYNKSQPL